MFIKKSSKNHEIFDQILCHFAIPYARMQSQVIAGAEFRLLHSNEHDDKQLFY